MKRALALALIGPLLTASAPAPVTPGYQPQDKDERGLWMIMDEAERQMKTSSFVIRDPELNAYVRGVFCRTVGQDECRDVRLYIVREPYFNASMAPNGMLQVWSGALLRAQNEAQLAAILGHEYTHYRNRHSLKLFREAKNASSTNGFLALGGLLALPLMLAVISQVFSYSRDQEAEADSGGLQMMAKAGYDPNAASVVWDQVRQEVEATASARNTKPRYHDGGLFADHPTSLDRMNAMRAQAATLSVEHPETREAQYRAAMSPWQGRFLDDQVKLNNFGATEFLLGQLAAAGWTGPLLYARGELYRTRGEPDDLKSAASFYHEAIDTGGAPPEAWRGLGLALLRQGDKAAGQTALKTYLTKRSDAPDRAMMQMLAGGGA